MSVDEGVPKPDRYSWPGADERELEVTCARIARHLSLARPRTVGFLPVGGEGRSRGARPMRLAPLLSRVAGALIGFVSDDVAIVDSWRTWTLTAAAKAAAKEAPKEATKADGADAVASDDRDDDAGASEGKDAAKGEGGTASRIREIQPRVLEVMPPGCRDATAAGAALRGTLAILRRSVSIVLVHLGGYADVGVVPSTLNLVDGVVMVVSARRTRRAAVAALVEQLPATKQLGAILVG